MRSEYKPHLRLSRDRHAYENDRWVCIARNADRVYCYGAGATPAEAYSVWKRLAAYRYSRRTTDVAA